MSFGGVAPVDDSNPFSWGAGATSSKNELDDSDFDILSELLVPTLPNDHPALLYLEETPRRNFTAKALVEGKDKTELALLRKSFEVIQSIFRPDSNEGMKLQLSENVDKSNQSDEDDIKNTFLGLILYCFNQYPWFSRSDPAGRTPAKLTQGSPAPTGPFLLPANPQVLNFGTLYPASRVHLQRLRAHLLFLVNLLLLALLQLPTVSVHLQAGLLRREFRYGLIQVMR